MTHIFVVNEQTFKVHLEYMFAGTGYSDKIPDFVEEEKVNTKADSVEKTFVSMIADISKVRENDLVAFYVTGCKKIFGFFQVVGEPFYHSKSEDDKMHLGDALGRYLPFRVRIKPFMVFSEGITEHQALDDIYNIEHPYQMCWSLIYRKLTGMRGCSFVTDYESTQLQLLVAAANNMKSLIAEHYTYDAESKRIVSTEKAHCYLGNTKMSLDIRERLLKVSNSYEGHLQAYITQNHDKGTLKSLLYPAHYKRSWLGNEVVCSVGEQRIDVLSIVETDEEYRIRIIELKDEPPGQEIVDYQIQWYIRWVGQYIAPLLTDKKVVIVPTVIANKFRRNCNRKTMFLAACNAFDGTQMGDLYHMTITPVEYIAFERTENDIIFHKVF